MKRFLLKCALLALIVGSILFLGSAAYTHSSAYKNLDILEGTDIFASMPEQIDVAVFGTSHGQSDFRYIPDDIDMFNFALGAQSPTYDLMMMREFGSRLRPGALVILTVSYHSLFFTETEADFAEKQPRYYRILSPENIVDVDPFQYVLHKYFSLLTDNLGSILRSILYPQGIYRQKDFTAVLDPAKIPAGQIEIRRDEWEGSISAWFPGTNPAMVDTFRQMLDMCRENGWKAVLVTPPYLNEFNDIFPSEFFPVFYDAVDSLCQEYDVPYLDYSHDSFFAGRYDLFRDISHLNLTGSQLFEEQFFSDLHEKGIW